MTPTAPITRADFERFVSASHNEYRNHPPYRPLFVVAPVVYDYMKRTGKSVGEIVAEALAAPIAEGEE